VVARDAAMRIPVARFYDPDELYVIRLRAFAIGFTVGIVLAAAAHFLAP
jgi:preprotein translocase subunit Sec61beta